MKPETAKTIMWVLLIGGVATAGYFIFRNNSGNKSNSAVDKKDRVVAILSLSGGQGDYNSLMALDDRFINDWYNAVKSKQPTFTSGTGKFDKVTGHATR